MIEIIQHCHSKINQCRRPSFKFTSTGMPDERCPFCGSTILTIEVVR